MDWLIYPAVLLPPLGAMLLSHWAVSPLAKGLLRYGGASFLLTFLLSILLEFDCGFLDLGFGKCRLLPQGFADAYSVFNLLTIMAYVSVAPVLLGLAAVAEFLARRKNR